MGFVLSFLFGLFWRVTTLARLAGVGGDQQCVMIFNSGPDPHFKESIWPG